MRKISSEIRYNYFLEKNMEPVDLLRVSLVGDKLEEYVECVFAFEKGTLTVNSLIEGFTECMNKILNHKTLQDK